MKKEDKKKVKKNKHHRILLFLLPAIFLIFLALAGLFFAVYKMNSTNRFIETLEKRLPFPAVFIEDAGIITIAELKADKLAVQKFYESQDFSDMGMRVDFSTEQGRSRLRLKEKGILGKLVENKIVEALAKKKGISISDSYVDEQVNASIQRYGNKEILMSELARLYGWSLDDFKQKVVKPELYSQKLGEAFSSEIDTSKEQEKINILYDRVAKNKEDFAKVASEASEGESSKNGGDLGWSTKEQLVAEIAEAAFSLETGQISKVVQSPLGYHIVKLEERKNVDGEDMARLRQIFVKTQTFGDWISDQSKNFKVLVFLQDYQWNKGLGILEFKDPGMRKFEENAVSNSEGDPSVFP